MNNLDEELKDILQLYRDEVEINREQYDKTGRDSYDLILGRAIADIKQVFLDILGHDEIVPPPPFVGEPFDSAKIAHEVYCKALGRNNLRAELHGLLGKQ